MINKNNEVCPRLTTFVTVCSWNFGGQSVVSLVLVVGPAARTDAIQRA
jgi:hypothetical protein